MTPEEIKTAKRKRANTLIRRLRDQCYDLINAATDEGITLEIDIRIDGGEPGQAWILSNTTTKRGEWKPLKGGREHRYLEIIEDPEWSRDAEMAGVDTDAQTFYIAEYRGPVT